MTSGGGVLPAALPHPHHQQSHNLGLMSCVRESSPQDYGSNTASLDSDRTNEPSKKRRFHPFRGLKKMFRRKVRRSGSEERVPPVSDHQVTTEETGGPGGKEVQHRSRSTSELLASEDPTRRKSGAPGGGIFPGLSVSHDSVFTADPASSDILMELEARQSATSLCGPRQLVVPGVRAELLDAVRRRRGRGDGSDDDEDLGLPRSPCNTPTTADRLDKSIKEHGTKSQSTCSDGSLLSMGSSEMDEDSFGLQSRNSSKYSLHDKRPSQPEGGLDLEDVENISAPLSHSAARHKMAVKPKRTHGAPRRRRAPQLNSTSALPTTPEVNEETSARSMTPDASAARETARASSTVEGAWSARAPPPTLAKAPTPATRLKSASLPPGAALPSAGAAGGRLSRSRSNAGGRLAEEEDEARDDCKKREESFFGRFLARRSAKKKKGTAKGKGDEESDSTGKSVAVKSKVFSFSATKSLEERTTETVTVKSVTTKPEPLARTATKSLDERSSEMPASIKSVTVKPTTEESITKSERSGIKSLPEPSVKLSADQTKLETKSSIEELSAEPPIKPIVPRSGPASRQRVLPIDIPASPESHRVKRQQHIDLDLPRSLKNSPESPSLLEFSPPRKKPAFIISQVKSTDGDSPSKVKISGLSAYQQRVLSYDEADIDDLGVKSVTKSHSFRSTSIVTASQESPSLPFIINTFPGESTDSLEPIVSDEPDPQEIRIVNKNNEVIQIDEPLKVQSTENISSVMITSDEVYKSVTDTVTISCVNSQVQSSVNTQTSNQVVVSISSPVESVSVADPESKPQVSITKVQFKRDSRVENGSYVPEFLKIQLNKVDAKPASNVVLSTAPELVENDKLELDVNVEQKRKFSNDVEIIDKDASEEIVQVPTVSAKPTSPDLKPKVQMRKSSLNSPTQTKPCLKKKGNSSDPNLSDVKSEDTPELINGDGVDKMETPDSPPEVVLRKKSLSTPKRDKDSDEPELMKVFARRSLKLKDSEAETLSQQVMVLVESSEGQSDSSSNRSRDSDKENETESPQEERKKNSFTKEPLTESKFVETSEVILRKPVNNKLAAFGGSKFSRVQSLITNEVNTNESDKRKNKSMIEPKLDTKPMILEKTFTRARITNFKEKEAERGEVISLKTDFENEEYVPMFKRIQQRKEEWELRAQQATKKTVP